jgi:hypothetical protein
VEGTRICAAGIRVTTVDALHHDAEVALERVQMKGVAMIGSNSNESHFKDTKGTISETEYPYRL